MLTRQNLKGNWGTLLLPVNADDSIDITRLAQEIDYLIAARVDGIYSNGTAGEFHNQTEDEFYAIQKLLAEKCQRANMRFQLGVSHFSPIVTLERLRRLSALQPSAFQLILPDWVFINHPEQINYLTRCAVAAAGIPLVLYNPPHAKKVLTPAELAGLSKAIPQLIGVKVAGGDKDWYDAMKWSIDSFSVFVPGHLLASGVESRVADGAYSNVACLSPKGAQAWFSLMHTDVLAALDIERRIAAFFSECVVPFKESGYSNPALDKLLAAAGGWADIGTRLRWPYNWIPETEVKRVAVRARTWVPEFF